MPMNVLGRGTVVPRGGMEDAEAEAHAARSAIASARIETSKVDTIVAPSRVIAEQLAAKLGIPNATAVDGSGGDGAIIEIAAALVENTPGRIVLAVEGVTTGNADGALRGAVAAVLTRAQPATAGVAKIAMPPTRRSRRSCRGARRRPGATSADVRRCLV